jgi:hypothetical protein
MAQRPDDQASLLELQIEIIGGSGRDSEYELRMTAPDGATSRGAFRILYRSNTRLSG